MAGGDQPALRQALMAAKACFVFGLVAAMIGLVAATSNPGDFQFHAQMQSQIRHAAAHQNCADTEAEALRLRAAALTLVLLGVAQAMIAATAVVDLAGGSLTFPGRCAVATALVVGGSNLLLLCKLVYRVAVVAGGQSAGWYVLDVWTLISIASSFVTFFFVSLAATLSASA